MLGSLAPAILYGVLAWRIMAVRGGAGGLLGMACALLAYRGHVRIWLWARCRSWPTVMGTFQPGGADKAGLQIEYAYQGEAFARRVQTRGAPGESVPIRVDPSDPNRTSLDLPPPLGWIAVTVAAVIAIVVLIGRGR